MSVAKVKLVHFETFQLSRFASRIQFVLCVIVSRLALSMVWANMQSERACEVEPRFTCSANDSQQSPLQFIWISRSRVRKANKEADKKFQLEWT